MTSILYPQIVKLRALEARFMMLSKTSISSEEIFVTIREEFAEIRSELDSISQKGSVEWGKETELQAAYINAQDVLKQAFGTYIKVLGYTPADAVNSKTSSTTD